MQYRLGKLPPKVDRRTLRLSSYITAKLPAPPAAVDHASKISAWGMMGNDRYGDCVMAALGHDVLQWTTYASSPARISDKDIIAAYLALSPNDDGLSMLDTLKWMRTTGLKGHKIGAFVQIDHRSRAEVQLAVQIFGNAFVGVALSDTNTFGPWVEVAGPPNPWNGHCITYAAYDAAGPKAATWGAIEPASWAWHNAYCDEAYAIASLEWLDATGKTVEGFDWTQLQYDLEHLGDPIGPDQPPAPPPPTPIGCNPLGWLRP